MPVVPVPPEPPETAWGPVLASEVAEPVPPELFEVEPAAEPGMHSRHCMWCAPDF